MSDIGSKYWSLIQLSRGATLKLEGGESANMQSSGV